MPLADSSKASRSSLPDGSEAVPAAVDAPQPVDATGAAALTTYYRYLMLAGLLVFVVLIGMTALFGWQNAREQAVAAAVHQVQEHALRLKGVLKAADDHVVQLARWAEDYPQHYPDMGANEIRQTVRRAMANSKTGEFDLDGLSSLPPERRLGLLNGLNSAAQPRPNGKPSNLDLAISLLDRFKYGQSTSGFLRWSYFFSAKKDLHVMSPWASAGEVLGAEHSIRSFLQESWTYEITKRGLPEQNPRHQRYWTKAYLDQAGAGMMVSLGAPVYWGDEFVGVMGTDVLLGFLSEFLWEFPDTQGVLLVTNEYGQLLADRKGETTAAADVRDVNVVLPAPLRPWAQQNAKGLEQGQRVGDDYVVAATLDDPRWTLIYVLPSSVVTQRTLKYYAPQLVVSLLLLIGVAVVHRILWRLYVAPALAVASYVIHETDDASPPAPVVPSQWKRWVDAMVRAFGERRQYMAQLAATNEILEHKVAERTQELMAANEQLEKLATTDPLTGTFNRRYMFMLLDGECRRAQRSGDALSILLLDVDHFKQINDTYGHVVGDAMLIRLMERCNKVVRATDSICRYGGEEFLVVLTLTDQEGAAQMGERLRHAVCTTPVVIDQKSIPMAVSVGVATYRPGESVEALINRADEMLYSAKAAGRNRLVRSQ